MKDILVLATAGNEDEVRFAFAEKLADAFDACIDVALAQELPSASATVPLAVPGAVAHTPIADGAKMDAALKAGAEWQAAIENRFAGRSPKVPVVRVHEAVSFLCGTITGLARTHDTFICTLPGHERDLELSGTILDHVLIEGGRSVIGLPQGYAGEHPFRKVIIAWNGSRESVRAVAEAMPLLEQAQAVVVLLVDQMRRAGTDERPGEDIMSHLSRHGIKATLAHVAKRELKTSEAILAEAKLQGGDLLVIGAQAEGGLLRWLLKDSVSRDVVSKTPMPLFMSH